ncbi:type II secretion system protein J [Synechococcus sp. 1G10]|uniref:PulJ/GspJ family protein n=1 Tax=Synechococcus sp. 1G10 TaxID=2025605 RepID=UPI0011803F11|nr:hypothetical protein [Synechococcus sp. 1G10]
MARQLWRSAPPSAAGFGLVELLLAMVLGLMVCGGMIQALVGEGQNAQRFSWMVRERAHQRRAMALIRDDLERATAVVGAGVAPDAVSCGLAGRTPVLQLRVPVSTGVATITYSVGAAPSGIWRGRVLMRCGPAYRLDGSVNPASTFQSLVVLDGLAGDPTPWSGCGQLSGGQVLNSSAALPFSACLDPVSGLVAMRLEQSSAVANGPARRVRSEAVAGMG